MKRAIPGRRACLFLAAFLFFPEPALSQFEEEKFFTVEEWVQTASKRLQRVEESPAAVTVITAEEIRNSGAASFCDLLQRVPGLEVMRVTSGHCDVGARGLNKSPSNGVLLLVNGRSVYEELFGVVLWNAKDFPLEMIEQIEVVRGPGSVLYGANAFHAVVNIIIRRPEDIQENLMSLTAGLDTIVGTVIGSGSAGRTSFLVSAGFTQFASYEDHEEVTVAYPRTRGGFTYDLGKWGKIQGEAGVQGGEQEFYYELLGKADVVYIDHNFMIKYELPKFYFRAFWNSLYYGHAEFDEVSFDQLEAIGLPVTVPEDFVVDTNIKSDVVDLEAQYIFDLAVRNFFTVGAGYRLAASRYTLIAVHDYVQDNLSNVYMHQEAAHDYVQDNLFNVYLQHEFAWERLFHTYLGVRWDHHSVTGSSFSPRGSILVSPIENHVLRVSAGRSFRNPSFIESRMDIMLPIFLGDFPLAIGLLGNEELDPEVLTSFEAGYQTSLLEKRLKLEANVFFNQIDGLIGIDVPFELETALEGELIGSMDNILDEEVWGVEAEVSIWPDSWLTAFANYTWTQVDDLTYGGIDLRTPEHKINAGVSAGPFSGLTGTLLVHYVGETDWPPGLRSPGIPREIWLPGYRSAPSYTLVNLRVAYRFLKDRAEAGVHVFNLLNDKHREFPVYGEEIGTRVTGSIRFNF